MTKELSSPADSLPSTTCGNTSQALAGSCKAKQYPQCTSHICRSVRLQLLAKEPVPLFQ